ncbi:MAG: response regulator [Aquabacterium sp.]|uniref:hybrid sensor histidine kinase/response regulator n=1 Tax=Aquabacterium sp. TaxID=1872578 RepID=UPI002723D7D8|nr:ATP-binding protein [Aquabacterium sp.]MDO9004425.1 response regulator [Aquabacterium sp.]
MSGSAEKKSWRWHGVVLAGVVVGMGTRALLQPWLADAVPFVLAFTSLIAVQAVAGRAAAIWTAMGCAVWALIPGLNPHPSHLHVAIFVMSALAVVFFLERFIGVSRPDAADDDTSVPSEGSLWWLRMWIAMSLVLPVVFFCSIAWYTRGQILDEGHARVDRAATIVREHASRVIETNGVIVNFILDELGSQSAAGIRAREEALHRKLVQAASEVEQVRSIWIWGGDGSPLVSNRLFPVPKDLNVNDRDYLVFCDQKSDNWYISNLAIGRTTGRTFFNVSRCRRAEDGSLLGAVAVSLLPQYFTDFYRKMAESEPGLNVTLMRDDGTVLARYPAADPNARPTPLAERGEPTGDAGPLVSLRRLEPYSVHVTASIDRAALLAEWQSRVAVLAAATFPAGLALAYVASVALRRASRELKAVRRLQEESEQRRRAEEALRHSQKLEALGQLTGGVAHDFNNLLMVVNTNAYLMGQLYPAVKDSKPLGAINRAVTAGTKLTRQLLAFSRRQALRPETVLLQDSLPALSDLFRTTLGGAVQLSIELAADTHPLLVDPAELELALLNLVINARDAMPSGGQLIISSRNLSAAELVADGSSLVGPSVELVVTDTGSGIPEAIRDRIFEPFFSTKSPGEGTGLGLSQVYGFCVQAKGEVLVRSNPGEGTSVLMRLPLNRAAEVEAVPEVATVAVPPLVARVLLVEDNPEVAEATCELIRMLGCQVTHLDSADAAQPWLADHHQSVDLVISDVIMPGQTSGIDLVAMIRREYPSLAVLLVTGYTKELCRAIEEGIAVLPKPFGAETLQQAMQGALNKASRATTHHE